MGTFSHQAARSLLMAAPVVRCGVLPKLERQIGKMYGDFAFICWSQFRIARQTKRKDLMGGMPCRSTAGPCWRGGPLPLGSDGLSSAQSKTKPRFSSAFTGQDPRADGYPLQPRSGMILSSNHTTATRCLNRAPSSSPSSEAIWRCANLRPPTSSSRSRPGR
jgi:hypothetical protein